MTQDDLAKSPQLDVVPRDTLEKVADARAFALWGENIGRGEPVSLSDADGIYGYLFPYALDTRQFPPHQTVFGQISALRDRHHVRPGDEHVPARYYSELVQFGRRFGSVCIAALYTDGPILWMSHFLAPFFLLGETAKGEASRRLGGGVALRHYYYLCPEEQYMEFASGAQSAFIDVNDPARDVSITALRRRVPAPRSEALAAAIRRSWACLTTLPSTGATHDILGAQLALDSDLTAIGLSIEEICATQTLKKIPYWNLIPIVDHTPKSWCVPTSKAMVLGFYDNYVKGTGTLLGFGRFIDYWYELTPGGFNLPNLIDEVLPPKDAAQLNNYTWTWTETNGDPAKQWNTLKGEIDAGRPCFFSIVGHTTAAFGYRICNNGDKFAIVYDPPNPSTPTYVNEYNVLDCKGIGAVTPTGGPDGENLIIVEPDGGDTFYTSVPNEIVWFVWGNSIKTARVSVSEDGGNAWTTVANNIPVTGGWNAYAWIPATAGARVRVKVEGLTAGNVLIAADGSFQNLEIKSAPSGSGWRQIWGPTDYVVASRVTATDDVLIYACAPTGDGIYRYDGTPMAWTKIGGPGRMFALDDCGQLYGLSPDGGGVFRYDGSPMAWTQVGGAAGAIYAGGSALFATNPQTGDLYQYSGKPMAWTRVGGPGRTFAVDRKGRLYGVSPDGSGVFRYDGTPIKWTRILQQSCTGIYAGGCGLYATGGSSNDVSCFSLAPSMWTTVGGPGRMFAVDDAGRLYGLSPDGRGVFRYEGAWNAPRKWTQVGGAAGKIFAAGNGRLFATNPVTGDLMSYE